MRVAGVGFRSAASLASLHEALMAAGGPDGVRLLATVMEKADAPVLLALADMLHIPIQGVAGDVLADIATLTHSPHVAARFKTGSVAEAAALAAAGKGARLLSPRAVSRDGMAVAAIVEIAERN